MPYKDQKKQRDAQRRSYLRDKTRHNRISNENRAKRRVVLNEYVRTLKAANPCPDCNVNYPYYVMDFDHVRGEKIGDVAIMVHEVVTLELLREEIEKCDIVCANCHRERTFGRLVPL